MKWGLILANPAQRSLRMLPAGDLEHINAAFEEMASDPFSGDIKFLKGTNGKIRRRVGDWRVIFAIDADHHLLIVLEIVRRGSTTY